MLMQTITFNEVRDVFKSILIVFGVSVIDRMKNCETRFGVERPIVEVKQTKLLNDIAGVPNPILNLVNETEHTINMFNQEILHYL